MGNVVARFIAGSGVVAGGDATDGIVTDGAAVDGRARNKWEHSGRRLRGRGSLLVSIFWTHKNCLWHSILAF